MPRCYTFTALATAILASVGIVAISFVVDPYRTYPAVPGISPETSVDLFNLMRSRAPYDVEQVGPSILVVGNSRAGVLPPDLLRKSDEVTYNASLPAATLRELRRMVEHAHATRSLESVLVGLDLQMFREGASDALLVDQPRRYRKTDPSLADRWRFIYQRLEDHWRNLFSVRAMLDVWQILFGSGPSPSHVHDDGTWDLESRGAMPSNIYYQRLTEQIYKRSLADKSRAIEFAELMELLDFTESHQIPTILFILPMHGLLMNTLKFADVWEHYLDWQRELVTLVDARNSDTKIFGVENRPALVLETIGAAQPLFRDGVHLTRRGGIQIFTCLAGPCNSSYQPTALDTGSINEYLEQVEALRMKYMRDNPAELAAARRRLNLDTQAAQ